MVRTLRSNTLCMNNDGRQCMGKCFTHYQEALATASTYVYLISEYKKKKICSMMLAIIDLYYNAKQNVYVEQLGS